METKTEKFIKLQEKENYKPYPNQGVVKFSINRF